MKQYTGGRRRSRHRFRHWLRRGGAVLERVEVGRGTMVGNAAGREGARHECEHERVVPSVSVLVEWRLPPTITGLFAAPVNEPVTIAHHVE